MAINGTSIAILLSTKIHRWSGYLALLGCKANVYVLGSGAPLWLVVDVIFLLLYIFWKLFFLCMEAKAITPKYEHCAIPEVKSLQ
jgi:hypothetical protein